MLCATLCSDLDILLCLKACRLRYVEAAQNVYIYRVAAALLSVALLTTDLVGYAV